MSTSRRRGFGLNKQAMVCIIHVVLVLFSSNFTNFTNSREYLIAYQQSLHDLVVVVAAVKNGTATTKNNGTSTADNTITDAASTGTKEIAP